MDTNLKIDSEKQIQQGRCNEKDWQAASFQPTKHINSSVNFQRITFFSIQFIIIKWQIGMVDDHSWCSVLVPETFHYFHIQHTRNKTKTHFDSIYELSYVSLSIGLSDIMNSNSKSWYWRIIRYLKKITSDERKVKVLESCKKKNNKGNAQYVIVNCTNCSNPLQTNKNTMTITI